MTLNGKFVVTVIEEQIKIANILSHVDVEIDELEAKLEKYRNVYAELVDGEDKAYLIENGYSVDLT